MVQSATQCRASPSQHGPIAPRVARTSRAADCGRSHPPTRTSTLALHCLGHSHTHHPTRQLASQAAQQSAGFSDTPNTCKPLRNSASQQRAHLPDSSRCGSYLSTSRPNAEEPPRVASPHGVRPTRAPSQIPCQSEPHTPELRHTAGCPATATTIHILRFFPSTHFQSRLQTLKSR